MSRSDFLQDRRKPHRVSPQLGMGAFRYFMAPVGLIAVDELPEKWGLIEVNARGIISVVAGHVCSKRAEQVAWRHERALAREWLLLGTMLGRVGDVEKLHSELKKERNERSRLARQCDVLSERIRNLNLHIGSGAEHSVRSIAATKRKLEGISG